jgi:two-component system cell cycle response regulator
MTARVLVVDDNIANVKLLESRLRAEYFEVLTAGGGAEALEICNSEGVDVVLLDVMMPGMDGFEVCRRLKANPRTQPIPVIMVTALDQPSDRIAGLEAGADDFLTKPVNDIALVTRVRNLARVKQMNDELLMRLTSREHGHAGEGLPDEIVAGGTGGKIALIEENVTIAKRIADALGREHEVVVASNEQEAERLVAGEDIDLVVISLDMENMDALRFCSHLRSHNRTRHLSIMMLSEEGDGERMLKAFDLGVNDYVVRPVDRNELLVRARTQLRRRRYCEYLHRRLEERVEQASRDPLTGMYNRRYLEDHMDGFIKEAAESGKGLSLILADIDFFKSVNDNYGHENGDLVIRQFASRLLQNIRRADYAFRIGGEEFVIVLPRTPREKALIVGERLRSVIEGAPFRINEGRDNISITTSMGLTSLVSPEDNVSAMLKRADEALYEAKEKGRNKVMVNAA